jgi:hypothetical protein
MALLKDDVFYKTFGFINKLVMFGLSKDERNLKEAKRYIENVSKSLENRKVLRDEAIAIATIGYIEIDKIYLGNHEEPTLERLKKIITIDFDGYFQAINEIKEFISKKENQENSESFFENLSALLYVENFFTEDYSDLIISTLVFHLERVFHPNADLLGNKFYGTFQTFQTNLFGFEGYGLGLSLSAFGDWEMVDRRGYDIDGQINFFKIYRLLREHKMKEKLSDYQEAKNFINNRK